MPWIVLIIAGLFEIGWAIGLKYTDGFTRLWPSVGTAGAMLVSIVLGESASWARLAWLAIIAGGIIGLKFVPGD